MSWSSLNVGFRGCHRHLLLFWAKIQEDLKVRFLAKITWDGMESIYLSGLLNLLNNPLFWVWPTGYNGNLDAVHYSPFSSLK